MKKKISDCCEGNALIVAYLEILELRLKKGRFIHTLGVVETAAKMARHYGVDPVQVMTAAALHDYAKNLSANELLEFAENNEVPIDDIMKQSAELLHGLVGAEMVRVAFAIDDQQVLDAIRYHTIGRKNMSEIEKIVYLADAIEPGRDYPGLEVLRAIAFEDLDKGVFISVKETLSYVLEKGLSMHPNSVDLYNQLVVIGDQ